MVRHNQHVHAFSIDFVRATFSFRTHITLESKHPPRARARANLCPQVFKSGNHRASGVSPKKKKFPRHKPCAPSAFSKSTARSRSIWCASGGTHKFFNSYTWQVRTPPCGPLGGAFSSDLLAATQIRPFHGRFVTATGHHLPPSYISRGTCAHPSPPIQITFSTALLDRSRVLLEASTMAATIQSVKARQIFDSRGNPTVEVPALSALRALSPYPGSVLSWTLSRHAVLRLRLTGVG